MSLSTMSTMGGAMIIAIALLRALFRKKLPPRAFVALWLLAALRLLVPFSIESPSSVFTRPVTLTPPRAAQMTPVSIPLQRAVEALPPEEVALPERQPIAFVEVPTEGPAEAPPPAPPAPQADFLRLSYFAGLLLTAALLITAYLRTVRRFRCAKPVDDPYIFAYMADCALKRTVAVRASDTLDSPITYGLFRPVIVLPEMLLTSDRSALRCVLEHEMVHIRRFDPPLKLVFAAAACVHFFNPLVWLMWLLVNRDMELACDRAVVKKLGGDARADYALFLVNFQDKLTRDPQLLSGFSHHAVKERIEAIMRYKKTTVWAILLAAVLIVMLPGLLMTSAATQNEVEVPEADVDIEEAVPIEDIDVAPDRMEEVPEADIDVAAEASADAVDVDAEAPEEDIDVAAEASADAVDVDVEAAEEDIDVAAEEAAADADVDAEASEEYIEGAAFPLPKGLVALASEDYENMSVAAFEQAVKTHFTRREALAFREEEYLFRGTFVPLLHGMLLDAFDRLYLSGDDVGGYDKYPWDLPGQGLGFGKTLDGYVFDEYWLDPSVDIKCWLGYDVKQPETTTAKGLYEQVEAYRQQLYTFVNGWTREDFLRADVIARLRSEAARLSRVHSTIDVTIRAVNFSVLVQGEDGANYAAYSNFIDNTENPSAQSPVVGEIVEVGSPLPEMALKCGVISSTGGAAISLDGENWYENGFRDPESGVSYRYDPATRAVDISPDNGGSWYRYVSNESGIYSFIDGEGGEIAFAQGKYTINPEEIQWFAGSWTYMPFTTDVSYIIGSDISPSTLLHFPYPVGTWLSGSPILSGDLYSELRNIPNTGISHSYRCLRTGSDLEMSMEEVYPELVKPHGDYSAEGFRVTGEVDIGPYTAICGRFDRTYQGLTRPIFCAMLKTEMYDFMIILDISGDDAEALANEWFQQMELSSM